MKKTNSGNFTGQALIDFRTQAAVEEALKLNGSKLKYEGRTLTVKQRFLEQAKGAGKTGGEKGNDSKEKRSNQALPAKKNLTKAKLRHENLLPMITKLLEVHASRNYEALALLAGELAEQAKVFAVVKAPSDYAVIIKNLPKEGVDEAALKEDFASCGGLKKVNIPRTEDGMTRGVANLYFKTQEGQKNALKRSGTQMQGKRITVWIRDQGNPKNSPKQASGKGKADVVKKGKQDASQKENSNSNKRKGRTDSADAAAEEDAAKKKMRKPAAKSTTTPEEGAVQSEALAPQQGTCLEKQSLDAEEVPAIVESPMKKSKVAPESSPIKESNVASAAEPAVAEPAVVAAEPKKRASAGFSHWFELRREKLQQDLGQADDEAVLRKEAKRRWAELSDEKRAKFEAKALAASAA
jgi:RNA recognition motif-containing protein